MSKKVASCPGFYQANASDFMGFETRRARGETLSLSRFKKASNGWKK